ncbi:hypothetical protein KW805_01350 [Candidatus Pacearchaeota archaeon]|nr:hypothetical protein [Candidatus Pacearchaeota archaeon]
MLSWLIIGGVIVLAFLLVKYKEVRHRFGLIAFLAIFLFFVFTIRQVYTSYHLDLKTASGVLSAGRVYLSWLGGVLHTMVRISGYTIHQEWGFNFTNSTLP